MFLWINHIISPNFLILSLRHDVPSCNTCIGKFIERNNLLKLSYWSFTGDNVFQSLYDFLAKFLDIFHVNIIYKLYNTSQENLKAIDWIITKLLAKIFSLFTYNFTHLVRTNFPLRMTLCSRCFKLNTVQQYSFPC